MTAALLRSPVFWFRLVSLVVVVSLALGVARLTWRLAGWDDGREAVWTPAALAPVGGLGGGDLAAILTWAPFGGGSGGVGGLPVSNMGMILRGVVYAPGGGSTALISNGQGPVQIFTVGEAPVGNAVIEAIEVDFVILNVGGRREALILPEAAGTSAPPPSAGVAAPMATPPAAAPAPDAQAAPASASPARSSDPAPQPVVTPAAVVDSLGVAPSPQGYVVGDDSAPQLLRAGLRPGDVIKSLNGQALGDPARDRRIFQRAAAGGRARVEVVRDGRTLTLTVPLR